MRLFWSPRSPFARKVMVVAHEVGAAREIETVATVVTAETFNADYARINPTGFLPALQLADGQRLYGSDVICEYLDLMRGDGHLLPASAPERFEVLRRRELANGVMTRAVRWLGERFRPPHLVSDDVISACRQAIHATLDAMELDAAAAAPDRFDMGDAAAACALAYVDFRFDAERWREGRPHLAERFALQLGRPSLRSTAYQAAAPA